MVSPLFRPLSSNFDSFAGGTAVTVFAYKVKMEAASNSIILQNTMYSTALRITTVVDVVIQESVIHFNMVLLQYTFAYIIYEAFPNYETPKRCPVVFSNHFIEYRMFVTRE